MKDPSTANGNFSTGFGLLLILVVAVFMVTSALTVLGASKSETTDRDIFVSGLIVYARLPSDTPEAKEHGSYPQLKSYDLHGGLAPRQIDVVGVVNGKSVQVLAILEIFPVVGVTNWRYTEGITDRQLLHSSKTVLASSVRLEQKIQVNGRTNVKYADIDLYGLITRWKDLGYWPAELIFKITVEPVTSETSVSNNIMEFRLPIHPPD